MIRDRRGRITVYTSQQGVPQTARTILEAHDGTIWVGGPGGVARFRNERWEPVQLPATPGGAVNILHEDGERRVWVATENGILRQDGATFTPVRESLNDAVLFSERDGQMLVASAAADVSLYSLTGSPAAGPRHHIPLAGSGRLTSLLAGRASGRGNVLPAVLDRRGNFWLGTNGDGLLRMDVDAGRLGTRYTERDGLSGDMVRDVLEDRDGNIWVATHSGLTRVTPASIRSVAVHTGAASEDISTIVAEPSGAVWIQAPGALVRVEAGGTRTEFKDGGGARFDRITAMHVDQRGTLWVATGDGRVVRRVKGHFEPVLLPDAPEGSVVTAITSQASGTIWMYRNPRLLKIDGATQAVLATDPPADIANSLVRLIFADGRGRLWIGADGARLAVYEQGAFRLLTDAHGVPPGNPSSIYEDTAGQVWMSSDSGVSTIRGDRVITLTTANGLPRDRTFFVIGDDEDQFWLGTGSGLVRVPRTELEKAVSDARHQLRLRLYDISDGLRGSPVARGYPTAVRTHERLWFVTSTGVVVVEPRQLRDALPSPVPRIEQVLVDGRPLEFSGAAPMTLPPGMKSLQVEYAALMLTAPTKVRFRHRLDGIDADWVDDGETRRTVYVHLPAGTYRFNVAASGGDGNWTNLAATVAFVMPPMWYQTRVFYATLAAMIALAFWAAWKVRVRQIKRRFADVLGERARVGREIHDTLLQSLVGMALQLDTLAEEAEQHPSTVKDGLGRIRRQVEHYIGEAQQSIWELRSPRLESADLAGRLRERAEPVLRDAGIAFDFSVSGGVRNIASHVDQQIMRIGMEAVVNAVRHAHARTVRMELIYEGDSVRLRVVDDGHGFNPEAIRPDGDSHWGLSIMRERAEQVGGRFAVASAPDRGTSIEIVAPYGVPA